MHLFADEFGADGTRQTPLIGQRSNLWFAWIIQTALPVALPQPEKCRLAVSVEELDRALSVKLLALREMDVGRY